ncbi:MAG: response regulator [Acidobacteria bacterium]|nr:response regulator [Acidobacteriota bacterium]MBI3281639.1 response regulator [Acidobacteriota bacterium]
MSRLVEVVTVIADMPQDVTVLVVTSDRSDISALQRILSHSNWRLRHVLTCKAALEALAHEQVHVVLCDRTLSDGTWRDLVDALGSREVPPQVIVMARCADEHLWGEVLNLGGFDLLAKPLGAREVYSVISHAWRQRKEEAARALRRGAAQCI